VWGGSEASESDARSREQMSKLAMLVKEQHALKGVNQTDQRREGKERNSSNVMIEELAKLTAPSVAWGLNHWIRKPKGKGLRGEKIGRRTLQKRDCGLQ